MQAQEPEITIEVKGEIRLRLDGARVKITSVIVSDGLVYAVSENQAFLLSGSNIDWRSPDVQAANRLLERAVVEHRSARGKIDWQQAKVRAEQYLGQSASHVPHCAPKPAPNIARQSGFPSDLSYRA